MSYLSVIPVVSQVFFRSENFLLFCIHSLIMVDKGFRAANYSSNFSQSVQSSLLTDLVINLVRGLYQNIIDIWREKPEEWLPYLAHKQKYHNREKDWWISNETFRISNGVCCLMIRDISRYQVRLTAFRHKSFLWSTQSAKLSDGKLAGL